MTHRFPVSLPDVYSWESQIWQYQECQAPDEEGITYFAGDLPDGRVVDCLLYWAPIRPEGPLRIVGILNHYPWDSALEKKGNVNIWVRRTHQRRGIGSALWAEAVRRWSVNLEQQRFTASGAALASHLAEQEER